MYCVTATPKRSNKDTFVCFHINKYNDLKTLFKVCICAGFKKNHVLVNVRYVSCIRMHGLKQFVLLILNNRI